MEISNPRRILAVTLADSAQHLSDIIKGTSASELPGPYHFISMAHSAHLALITACLLIRYLTHTIKTPTSSSVSHITILSL
jgi:hypothetical protein